MARWHSLSSRKRTSPLARPTLETVMRRGLHAPPPCGKNLRAPQHLVEVVERLPLPHEHDIGKRVALGQRVNLIQYVGGGQRSGKALTPCHTKGTPHLAAYLTRYAKCGTITVGNVDRLYKMAVGRAVEILHRTVDRALAALRSRASYDVARRKPLARRFREVCHALYIGDVLAVNPIGHLLTRKFWKSQCYGYFLQFAEGTAQQNAFFVIFLYPVAIHFYIFREQKYEKI